MGCINSKIKEKRKIKRRKKEKCNLIGNIERNNVGNKNVSTYLIKEKNNVEHFEYKNNKNIEHNNDNIYNNDNNNVNYNSPYIYNVNNKITNNVDNSKERLYYKKNIFKNISNKCSDKKLPTSSDKENDSYVIKNSTNDKSIKNNDNNNNNNNNIFLFKDINDNKLNKSYYYNEVYKNIESNKFDICRSRSMDLDNINMSYKLTQDKKKYKIKNYDNNKKKNDKLVKNSFSNIIHTISNTLLNRKSYIDNKYKKQKKLQSTHDVFTSYNNNKNDNFIDDHLKKFQNENDFYMLYLKNNYKNKKEEEKLLKSMKKNKDLLMYYHDFKNIILKRNSFLYIYEYYKYNCDVFNLLSLMPSHISENKQASKILFESSFIGKYIILPWIDNDPDIKNNLYLKYVQNYLDIKEQIQEINHTTYKNKQNEQLSYCNLFNNSINDNNHDDYYNFKKKSSHKKYKNQSNFSYTSLLCSHLYENKKKSIVLNKMNKKNLYLRKRNENKNIHVTTNKTNLSLHNIFKNNIRNNLMYNNTKESYIKIKKIKNKKNMNNINNIKDSEKGNIKNEHSTHEQKDFLIQSKDIYKIDMTLNDMFNQNAKIKSINHIDDIGINEYTNKKHHNKNKLNDKKQNNINEKHYHNTHGINTFITPNDDNKKNDKCDHNIYDYYITSSINTFNSRPFSSSNQYENNNDDKKKRENSKINATYQKKKQNKNNNNNNNNSNIYNIVKPSFLFEASYIEESNQANIIEHKKYQNDEKGLRLLMKDSRNGKNIKMEYINDIQYNNLQYYNKERDNKIYDLHTYRNYKSEKEEKHYAQNVENEKEGIGGKNKSKSYLKSNTSKYKKIENNSYNKNVYNNNGSDNKIEKYEQNDKQKKYKNKELKNIKLEWEKCLLDNCDHKYIVNEDCIKKNYMCCKKCDKKRCIFHYVNGFKLYGWLNYKWTDPDGFLELSIRQKKKFDSWKRLSDLYENPIVMSPYLYNNCIRQGFVADCSFLSSLTVLIEYEKKHKIPVISSIITPCTWNYLSVNKTWPIFNPCGMYICRLHCNGIQRKIIIDDYVPVKNNNSLLVAYSNNQKELWVTLLEKAFVKLMGGSYSMFGSNPGSDLYYLTGWIPVTISLKSKISSSPPSFDKHSMHSLIRDEYIDGYNDGYIDGCTYKSEIVMINNKCECSKNDEYIDDTRYNYNNKKDDDQYDNDDNIAYNDNNYNYNYCCFYKDDYEIGNKLEKQFLKEELTTMDFSKYMNGSVDNYSDLIKRGGYKTLGINYEEGKYEEYEQYDSYEEYDKKWDSVWNNIYDGIKKGKCVVCLGTLELKDAAPSGLDYPEGVSISTGIVTRHAYSILNIEDYNGDKLLYIKNPWGCIRWKGRYSHNDIETWTKELQKKLNYSLEKAISKDDGCFWIPWKDVIKYFSHIYICWNSVIFPYQFEIHTKWENNNLLNSSILLDDTHLVAYNPQFALHLNVRKQDLSEDGLYYIGKKPIEVWILLSRHVRERKSDVSQKYLALHVHAGNNRIICPLFPIKQGIYSNGECTFIKLIIGGKDDLMSINMMSESKKEMNKNNIQNVENTKNSENIKKGVNMNNMLNNVQKGNSTHSSGKNNNVIIANDQTNNMIPNRNNNHHRDNNNHHRDNNDHHGDNDYNCVNDEKQNFENDPDVLRNVDYVLIVSQYSQKEEFNFTLKVFSHTHLSLYEIPPLFPDNYSSLYFKGKWTNKSAGGCSNNLWSYFRNPHVRLYVPECTRFYIFLECSQEHSVNLRIFKGNTSSPRSLKKGDIISSGPYKAGCCYIECTLESGIYCLMPSLYRANVTGNYQICIHYPNNKEKPILYFIPYSYIVPPFSFFKYELVHLYSLKNYSVILFHTTCMTLLSLRITFFQNMDIKGIPFVNIYKRISDSNKTTDDCESGNILKNNSFITCITYNNSIYKLIEKCNIHGNTGNDVLPLSTCAYDYYIKFNSVLIPLVELEKEEASYLLLITTNIKDDILYNHEAHFISDKQIFVDKFYPPQ
ncbi:calpain [Plasmodium sp. DRC-Itaito]|nr:calpain [Plasmodium sp. DRC-Itaito]